MGRVQTQQNTHYGSCSNSAKHSLWVVFKLSKTLTMGRVQTQQNTHYGSCFKSKYNKKK
ncbi:hypothetical protein [Leptospira noguchii]|uniref:hypothetical protein n=1 Tax=Leptospira noguchii TaxID=28182 RepID=UPI0018DEE176|nr:hypothetical protein [Leptospira noguchii]